MTVAQSEINIAIGDRVPEVYFKELAIQCKGGTLKYGGITNVKEMRNNLLAHAIPESLLDGNIPEYNNFLENRRKLMAGKIRSYFESL